jgi:zinc protease
MELRPMRRLLIGLCAAVAALPLSLGAEGISDQVTSFDLDNGMQVVVIEDHRAPVIVHMVWYRAGSADEWAGVSGVAHFLEHLLFKGTETLAPGEFSKVVAANGGNDNAFTSFDYTGYWQRVAADRLELMMRMESDRMMNLQLSEGDIVTERDVILEERNMRVENDPGSLFREQKRAVQYLNHRYGVPVIGWKHEMQDLSLDDALAYYRLNYAPNNAILIVAGDTTPDEVRALAETYYGPIAANPELTDRVRSAEPPQTAARRMVFADPRVAQPYVARSYLAPERDPGDQEKAAALVILAELLGGSQTALLSQKLQFETQTAIYSGAWYDGTTLDDTTFDLIVVPVPGVTLQEAEDAMDRVVAEFMATGPDPAQMERIKMQLRASQVYARDNVQGLARAYGDALTSGLGIDDIRAWPGILQAVTPEEVMAAAREVLDKRRSVTGWLVAEETQK